VAGTFANVFVTLAVASAAFVASALAQPREIKPLELSDLSDSIHRRYGGPTEDSVRQSAQRREEARKTSWAEEARAIARSGQNVIRDEDELVIYFGTSRESVVLRTGWYYGVVYVYQSFDDIGRFHVVAGTERDGERFLIFVAAGTGEIYAIGGGGPPVYSPDKTRFFSADFMGMGCVSGITVYRREGDKLFSEAKQSMDCNFCTHEWSGPSDVKSNCVNPAGKVEYRLRHRNGVWEQTKSEITP
jgi:hypothetical protein